MEETILIVGDHDAVRKALRERLKMVFPRFEIIEAAVAEEVMATVLHRSPGLVLMDIGPLATEWLEVARRIKAVRPFTQIVVWAMHDWESYRADALAAGATAYVLKEETQDQLLSVLAAILSTRSVSKD
jgi:DNA-binding NarL/FixJ family response regulator